MIVVENDEGEMFTGFGARNENKSLVMSDIQGKPIRIPLADIASRRTSTLSPMPANVADLMSEQEFYDLLSFLLQKR